MDTVIIEQFDEPGKHNVLWRGFEFEEITEHSIARVTIGGVYFDKQSCQYIIPTEIDLHNGVFSNQYQTVAFPDVDVKLDGGTLHLSCSCKATGMKLCEHQAHVVTAIVKREEFRIFFDDRLRSDKLKQFALDYGMENEKNLDRYFKTSYFNKRISFSPRSAGLIPVTKASINILKDTLLTGFTPMPPEMLFEAHKVVGILLRQHKYYGYLIIELFDAPTTKDGKIKNPLTPIPPLDLIWKVADPDAIRFFTGIHKFQNHNNTKRNDSDLQALRSVVRNPLKYRFYYHDNKISESVTSTSAIPIGVSLLPHDLNLTVNTKDQFFELSGSLTLNDTKHLLKDLITQFSYFVHVKDTFYLVDNLQVLSVIDFLKNKPDNLLVHASRYQEFKTQLLNQLDGKLNVDYQYIKTATELQLKQQDLNEITERIIYLSDFGQHVMLNPVIRYGEAEVTIRNKKLIYGIDNRGEEYKVQRVEEDEIAFIALLIRQHPQFEEQVENDLEYFYLHKRYFLQENWFLKTFEEWHGQGITVLGFNEIEGNKLNPNKIKITIKVLSGINWFNLAIDVRFGKKKATLKQVQRAVKNKSRYIQLDDGSQGILPAEWLEKFTRYFNYGEIVDDENLRMPKINFSEIEMLYEQQMLDEAVKNEIGNYRKRMNDFESIIEVAVPAELKGTLREYQKQGLNWLNFLDDFNFGGCLADDMGLGKTIQIIAFILSQRSKTARNVNLLVVPTSLIFNWQAEVAKFAPSIKIRTIYGADRVKSVNDFNHYEIILTSYGTLLADISFLKEYEFNYVFLDESQHIKNPESQRYRSVKLLKSRNKIVITGTPIENNTFDLYGQLSFACPGLLGSKQYFRDVYLAPIDQFKNKRRSQELQNKIKPFILRRTKQEVAKELPDKTEMVLYCEMGEEQRSIYNAYEKEFREYISATTNDDLRKSPMNLLKGLTKLRQICDSPMLLKGDKLPGEQSAKINILMDEISGKMGQHKILVFSQFVSMLDLIRNELVKKDIRFTYLTGSTRNRESVVNEFQTNNDVRVFLISLKAGGTGLNLTEADYVYLIDPWWNPAVENQAIDRSHRIGQNKHIVAVRLICPDTVEEKMMRVQESKRELFKDLINNNNSFISSLSKQELLGLVGWRST